MGLQTGRVLAGLYSMANVEFPRLLYSHWPLRLRGGCHRQFQSGRLPGALARPCCIKGSLGCPSAWVQLTSQLFLGN